MGSPPPYHGNTSPYVVPYLSHLMGPTCPKLTLHGNAKKKGFQYQNFMVSIFGTKLAQGNQKKGMK